MLRSSTLRASKRFFRSTSSGSLGNRAVIASGVHTSQKLKGAVASPTVSPTERSAVATEKAPKVVQPLNRKPLASEMDDSFVGMSGGEIFHEMMLRHNVEHVFGYPGGAILPVFDAIYDSKYFDFILPRHEQGAGHMAEGYARAT
ncbi:hypothetical protein G6F56_007994 [Rhizopus delemar]|nr:hypothetical protein G6F56_007994 [Rhizopus delemar]